LEAASDKWMSSTRLHLAPRHTKTNAPGNIVNTYLTHAFPSQNLAYCDGRDIYKGSVIPVRGCRGPYGSETSRLPYFLDNQLTDGFKVGCVGREIMKIIINVVT
jgi:hypothetical protein